MLYFVSDRGSAYAGSAKRLLGLLWSLLYGVGFVYLSHWLTSRYGLSWLESFGVTIAAAIAVGVLVNAIRDKFVKRTEQAWP
jgi:hypothetical protein